MIRQVELLLELAQTETVTAGADARIDLGHLAQDMAARLYPVARRAGRDIAVESPARGVVVTGDPALMESAVETCWRMRSGFHRPAQPFGWWWRRIRRAWPSPTTVPASILPNCRS